jgi:serine/threonine protein kinase
MMGGTPAWYSPEQWQSIEEVTAKTDIYATGLIALYCHKRIYQSTWLQLDNKMEHQLLRFVEHNFRVTVNEGIKRLRQDANGKNLKRELFYIYHDAYQKLALDWLEKIENNSVLDHHVRTWNLQEASVDETSGDEDSVRRDIGNNTDLKKQIDKKREEWVFKLQKLLKKFLLRGDQCNDSARKRLQSDGCIVVPFSTEVIQKIELCLSVDPETRPSASELCQALEKIIIGFSTVEEGRSHTTRGMPADASAPAHSFETGHDLGVDPGLPSAALLDSEVLADLCAEYPN